MLVWKRFFNLLLFVAVLSRCGLCMLGWITNTDKIISILALPNDNIFELFKLERVVDDETGDDKDEIMSCTMMHRIYLDKGENSDQNLKVRILQLTTRDQELVRDRIYTSTSNAPVRNEDGSRSQTTAKPKLVTNKPQVKGEQPEQTYGVKAQKSQDPATSTSKQNNNDVIKEPKVTTSFPVDNDFHNESHFEPFCAMYSNAHKYLIWPDIPTDLTDWTYKRKRKCPKLVIPDNLKNTKRVKFSLNCDQNKPKLVQTFTNTSDDIQILELNNPCLAVFTNSCCNDNRGIPNIVHYVWYFKNEMKFYMFLSMMSIIRFVRPCLILFHGEYLPYGKYWDYIIRIYPNIIHIKRPRPLTIFGKKISHHEHSGDIMRMEALMQLGGMYFDTDVITLRDLEPLRDYDMTLCRQASGYLLNAFIMAKKNTTFLNLWMDGYRKDYRNDSYVFNSMWYNNDLAYNRTDLIHVEEGTLCAPAVLIGKPINSTMVYNWSTLYGFHLYARTIHFPWDVDWIKNFNTTMGSMVRHVVYGNKELCV